MSKEEKTPTIKLNFLEGPKEEKTEYFSLWDKSKLNKLDPEILKSAICHEGLEQKLVRILVLCIKTDDILQCCIL